MTYTPPIDCRDEFRVRAGKRVTDGSTLPGLSDYNFQTINPKVSSQHKRSAAARSAICRALEST